MSSYIDKRLTFKYHINRICSKSSKTVGLFNWLELFLSPEFIKTINHSLVHLYLNYTVIGHGTGHHSIPQSGVGYHREKPYVPFTIYIIMNIQLTILKLTLYIKSMINISLTCANTYSDQMFRRTIVIYPDFYSHIIRFNTRMLERK